MEEHLSIANDFSNTPGARYRDDGEFSGEAFYDDVLRPRYIKALEEKKTLVVNLDGTHGYATSFLDEAFGRLSKEFGKDNLKTSLRFISEEEPYLIQEIQDYIDEAVDNR